jgi:hypothetical protein
MLLGGFLQGEEDLRTDITHKCGSVTGRSAKAGRLKAHGGHPQSLVVLAVAHWGWRGSLRKQRVGQPNGSRIERSILSAVKIEFGRLSLTG